MFSIFSPRRSAPDESPSAAGQAPPGAVARLAPALAAGLRWLAWAGIALAVLLAAAYVGIRHFVWPQLDRWRPSIEHELAKASGRPIRLGTLVTGFDGLRPWLVAQGVSIDDADGQRAFSADRVRAVLSLRALASGRPRLALLEVQAPVLRVERLAAHRLRIEWNDRVLGESAQLQDVDIAIGSAGRLHRASLHVPALLDAAGGVDAAIEFRRAPFARPGDWRQWEGEAYLGVERIELAALSRRWHDWFGMPAGAPQGALAIAAGQGRLRAWSHFQRGVADGARVKLALDDVAADLDGRRLPIRSLSLEADAHRDAEGATTFAFPRLRVDDDRGHSLVVAGSDAMLQLDRSGRPLAGRLSLGRFDTVGVMDLLARLPVPDDLRRRFEPLRVAGTVSRLAIDWKAGAPVASEAPSPEAGARPDAGGAAPTRYAVELDFEHLSFRRVEAPPKPGELRLPSFANVSGSARLTEGGGSVALHGDAVVLRFPGLFAEPEVPLEQLEARAAWTLGAPPAPEAPPAVDVHIESFRFANADAAGEVTGHYRSGGKGAGIVDLQGRLQRADATRTARYLPLEIPAEVRDWVREAVLAGRSDDVRFVLAGDLEDFPYRDPRTGEFRVEARLQDARLAYAPGWPAIERIQGQLRFERAGMDIEVQSGRVWNVALARTHAAIAEFREPLLRVEGSGVGPAQDMVRFVNESPLRTRIDDFARDLAIEGGATLQLALELPIEALDDARVRGSVQLAGNTVRLERTLPPFDAVGGRLEFTEDRLALRSLTATLLGGPVSVEGDTPAPGRFLLHARGTVPAAGIVQLADNALTRGLSGSTAYRAEVEMHRRASTLTITSDLAGLASSLPAPFDKAADAKWPLRIESVPVPPSDADERPAKDTLRVTLRDDVRLVFEREREPGSQRLLVRRGAFALDDTPTLPDAGFAVLLRAPGVDLDAWNALLGQDLLHPAQAGGAEGYAPGFSLLPDTVSLVAGTVEVAGKVLHDVVLGASRAEGYWRANVHAREIDGYFSWREAAADQSQGTLVARFTRLEIPPNRIGEFETLLDSAPQTLPALDVAAEELILDERRLGALSLKATNGGSAAAPVWRLEQLRIRHPSATLEASGSWQTRPGGAERDTALDFELRMNDTGALLATLGFPGTVSGGAGTLGGKIRWNGSPLRLDYRSLGGELSLALGKGQFLKSDPGIAKLIGVLSLQSLRRRLTFDFRDVFADGFAFDEIGGHAKIDAGIARTQDFHMRGVAASVRIRGEANVAAETQSLVVEVQPELNAGLASLAYAALANPAIGLGSFVAQMMLREPLQRMFAYEYDVTGPWSDPQVAERRRPAEAAPGAPGAPAVPGASGTPAVPGARGAPGAPAAPGMPGPGGLP